MPKPNQVDPQITRSEDPEADRDINALFSRFRLDQSSYRTFSRQVEIRESLAEGVVLPFFVPKSQAAVVCSEIAQWLEIPMSAALSRSQKGGSER
jgi:chromosome partitioning protein